MDKENSLIIQAENIFWYSISSTNIHSRENFAKATVNVEKFLQHEVLSENWIKNNITDSEKNIAKARELLNIIFIEGQYKLSEIGPIFRYKIPAFRLSLVGLIGNIVGAFLFYKLFNILNIDSFLGLCIGSLLGTFIFILLSLRIALSSKVKSRFLFFFRGAEIFDKYEYTVLLQNNINNWIFHIRLLYKLIIDGLSNAETKNTDSNSLLFIIDELNKLKTLEDKKDIERELSFIYQYLDKKGISSAGKNNYVWNEKMALYYETYGIIEDGDSFSVEEEAIIDKGTVIKKGIARKIRK